MNCSPISITVARHATAACSIFLALSATLLPATAMAVCIGSHPTSVGNKEQDTTTEIRLWIEQFTADRNDLNYKFRSELDNERFTRFQSEYAAWLARIESADFDSLSIDAKVDLLLLRNFVSHELQLLQTDHKRDQDALQLIPFSSKVVEFIHTRDRMKRIDGSTAATTLHEVTEEIKSLSRKTSQRESIRILIPLWHCEALNASITCANECPKLIAFTMVTTRFTRGGAKNRLKQPIQRYPALPKT